MVLAQTITNLIRILMVSQLLLAGAWAGEAAAAGPTPVKDSEGKSTMEMPAKTAVATLAGGCFWCVEADFEKVPGVLSVISGYTGGSRENPSYDNYADSGHIEAVQVYYDPRQVSYQQLLDYFWRHIDPTDGGGQFVDRGPQYRSAIFYHAPEQKRLAEASKEALARSGRFKKPMATEILPLAKFYSAEDYHQDYYLKHAVKYKYYRWNSGRDQFLQEVWGKK